MGFGNIPFFTGHHRIAKTFLFHHGPDTATVPLGKFAMVPFDIGSPLPLNNSPSVCADNGDTFFNFENILYASNFFGSTGIERFYFSAKSGAPNNGGVNHIGYLDINTILSCAVDARPCIHAGHRFPNKLEIFWAL